MLYICRDILSMYYVYIRMKLSWDERFPSLTLFCWRYHWGLGRSFIPWVSANRSTARCHCWPWTNQNINLSESALPHLFIILERNSSLMVLYDCFCHRELRNVPTCSSSRTNNRRNKDVTLFLPYATSARQLSVYWGQHFSTSAYNGVVCHHIRGRASPDFTLFRL